MTLFYKTVLTFKSHLFSRWSLIDILVSSFELNKNVNVVRYPFQICVLYVLDISFYFKKKVQILIDKI